MRFEVHKLRLMVEEENKLFKRISNSFSRALKEKILIIAAT
jgi:hypothetical protein